MSLEPYTLRLEGRHFNTAYLIYVLRLSILDREYLYVGQTGDNNHLTARPAFRRLAGHFEDSHTSTQNKIYRFIAKELLNPTGKKKVIDREVKSKVEGMLREAQVEAFVYPLMEFDHRNVEKRLHKEKVKQVREFEKYVVRWLDACGYNLINTQRSSIVYPMEKLFPEKYERICRDFPELG